MARFAKIKEETQEMLDILHNGLEKREESSYICTNMITQDNAKDDLYDDLPEV